MDPKYDKILDAMRENDTEGMSFIDLDDVPSSYSGQALKGVRVNAAATGLEFFTGSGLVDWGEIGGTLSDQTDLQTALNLKADTIALSSYLPLAGGTMVGDILMTSNKIIGGSTTTSDLTLQTTSGVGTTGADMHFLVGNNGATEAMTILNSGNVGIGTITPTLGKLEVVGSTLTQRLVEANTAVLASPNIITSQETFSVYTNEGTGALNYHTLPTAAAGLQYTFHVDDADGIHITANTDDIIQINGVVSSAAGYAESLTIGSSLTLIAINATDWIATSSIGTWNVA
jgi:hypothetical protein